jgi:hypothetical protein
MRTDGETDITKLIVAFRNFPNAPEKDLRFSLSRKELELREGGVREDARKLGERNWRNAARKRNSWRKLQKKALAQNGLLCQ